MKLVSLLSRLAALGFAASLLAVAFNAAAVALLAVTAGAFLTLIIAHDYAPRRASLAVRRAAVREFAGASARATETRALAA